MKMKMVRSILTTPLFITSNSNYQPASDPFETHFANPNEGELSKRLQAISDNRWHSNKKLLSDDFRLVYSTPEIEGKEESFPPAIRDTGSVKVR